MKILSSHSVQSPSSLHNTHPSTGTYSREGECGLFYFPFLVFIECIGMTLGNKIIQVSGAKFYPTSSVHHTVCSPPQVKSPSITLYPSIPSSTSPHLPPPSNHYTLVCVHEGFFYYFLFNPSSPTTPSPLTAVSLLSIYESVLFISSFCSLDSTYE